MLNEQTNNSSQSRNPFWQIHFALKDFYRSYPSFFLGGRLDTFVPLYYPIAILDLDIEETSSEEFEIIEHSILELVSAEVNEPTDISKVLGLPINYVNRILAILEGYGHIENRKLTELGKMSLQEELKYTKHTNRQKIQIDSLSGVILTKEVYQPITSMFVPGETIARFKHIIPNGLIYYSQLDNLLGDFSRFKSMKKEILHTNAERIDRIVSKEIRFAIGYLVKLSHISDPFVIIKARKVGQNKEIYDKNNYYYWKPIAITETIQSQVKELKGIEIADSHTFDILRNMFHEITNSIISEMKDVNRVIQIIADDFKVDVNMLEITIDGATISINSKLPLPSFVKLIELEYLPKDTYLYLGLMNNHKAPDVVCYVHVEKNW